MAEKLKYKRILLKISGEALGGESGRGLDFEVIDQVCGAVARCAKEGVQIGIVVGGGNFWRGLKDGKQMKERTRADQMGMLATAMNCLALEDILKQKGVGVRVMTAVPMSPVAEPYDSARAVRHMKKGRVVIFGCGTGNPYFSTDTAATLRGAEIGADVVMMAKNIDGVYSSDPKTDPGAVKYDEITYDDILSKHLKVIDSTAASMAMDNKLPLLMFALKDPENILRAVHGEKIGTLVKA